MKTTYRRPLALLVILMLLASLFAACSGSGNNEGDAGNNDTGDSGNAAEAGNETGNAGAEEDTGPPMVNGKYDPVIQTTTVRQIGPEVKFKNGETINDNVFSRWLKDTLGIEVKTLWTTPTTNDAYKTKLMLSLSANEPLPDFLVVPAAFVHDLIDSGKFRPVDDLFEKYASDEWKTAMAETADIWLPYMRDGKAYAIPMIENSLEHLDVMWIRQDWLDNLGLQAPTTIAELETVMDAFVNGDPNRSGKKDTIAITAALKEIKYNRISWLGLTPLFGSYGSFPHVWHKSESGEIVYGTTTPETKQALGKVKEWLDKGYLHKEAGLHDEVKAIELFNSGQAGIAIAPSWAYGWPFKDVEKNVPGAKVMPYPIPAGPDGKLGQIDNGLNHWLVLLINKDMEYPEVLFAYQNYMYEHYEDPAEGSVFEHGFAKNYDYDIVDGKVVTADADIPGGRANPVSYFPMPKPVVPSKQIRTLASLHDGKTPETPFEKLKALEPPVVHAAAKIVLGQAEHALNNLYNGPVTPTMADKQENLDKMEAEMFSKIIYGNIPLDDFDKWVEDWKNAGGDQLTREVVEWYNAAMGN